MEASISSKVSKTNSLKLQTNMQNNSNFLKMNSLHGICLNRIKNNTVLTTN
jgi:hypothetical protein